MKKMNVEAQMNANGGKSYYCPFCGKKFTPLFSWFGLITVGQYKSHMKGCSYR